MNDQESSETGAGSESARSNPAGSESEAAGTEAAGTEPAAGVESAAGVDFPVAADGLGSLHGRMRAAAAGGEERDLGDLLTRPPRRAFRTATVTGSAEADRELSLPYRGQLLRGDDLARRLD